MSDVEYWKQNALAYDQKNRELDHFIMNLEAENETLKDKLFDCEICNQKLISAAEGNGAYVVKPKFIEKLEAELAEAKEEMGRIKKQLDEAIFNNSILCDHLLEAAKMLKVKKV